MKNRFLTCFFALATTLAIAQTSTHLSFKGVPIDGTLSEYVTKMKTSGFIHVSTEKGVALLNGDFAGYKNCNVTVATLTQKDLVYKINVHFPSQDTWSKLSADYFELKKLLTEKYGAPNTVVENFGTSSVPENDEYKMFKVKTDGCKYYSIWKTDKGDIQLSIDYIRGMGCLVKLQYTDKENGDIIKAKAIDDL